MGPMSHADDEAFPGRQFSKGFVRCASCTLVRPAQATAVTDGKRYCKDVRECARMKLLKEEGDRGEAEVTRQQKERALPEKERALPVLPEPEEREVVAAPKFWNSNLFLV